MRNQKSKINNQKIIKIAITGGKGGTGKSTIAILFANKLVKEIEKVASSATRRGGGVILCDCDVECPNDYLLLGQKLKKPQKKVYAEFPKLNKTKCKKCGLCAKTCRNNAIFQPPGKYPVFIKDLCSGCGACWIVCPHGAIEPEKEEVGQIFVNKIKDNFWLITGSAKPGLEETGPIVSQTKKFALNLAKKNKANYILFDTAPGIHCPVISAILDCDLAYAVTEPTPMGAHDLNLILDLCQKLKVKTKIILNQANLGDKTEIENITKKYKIKIDKEIPYSKKLVKAYSQGKLLNFFI
ncbi:ATP-binding protein [Patescibacteria group bacterium]|nr:ATP-binding protein [Patescibacteria group bacterium]